MPIARFQMPDGRIGRFEVPEGTQPEQAQALIEQSLQQTTDVPRETKPKDISQVDTELTIPERIASYADKIASAGGDVATRLAPKIIRPFLPSRQNLVDVAAGASGLMRGGVNLVSEGVGEKLWPTSAASPESGARTLGSLADPVALAVGGGAMKLAQLAPKAAFTGSNYLRNLIGGTAGGAAVGGLSEEGTAGQGAAIGGALSAGIPALAWLGKKGYTLIRNLIETIPGMEAKAGARLIEQAATAAGTDKQTIIKAMEQARPGITAGQAAVDVAPTEFAALDKLSGKIAPTPHQAQLDLQQANRIKTLERNKPDLKAAEEARAAISEVDYGKAFAADKQRIDEANRIIQGNLGIKTGGILGKSEISGQVPVIPEIAAMKDNPIIEAAAKEAAVLAKSKGLNIGDPRASLQGLHFMKLAIDNQFKNRSASTALQNYTDDALRSTKSSLLGAIEGTSEKVGISPLYKLAREKYAEMSKPVNQAKIIDEIVTTLKTPKGGENVTGFVNALGKGESALLKRADQSPRIGNLEDFLTKEQMGAVEDVTSQLTRDAKLAEREEKGAAALTKMVKEEAAAPIQLHGYLSRPVSIFNSISDVIHGKANERTVKYVADVMRDPKTVAKILKESSPEIKSKLIAAINQYRGQAIGSAVSTGTQD